MENASVFGWKQMPLPGEPTSRIPILNLDPWVLSFGPDTGSPTGGTNFQNPFFKIQTLGFLFGVSDFKTCAGADFQCKN